MSSAAADEEQAPPEPMSNLYQEWSIEDDLNLYKNRRQSVPQLASLLGRGLRGVKSRLEKLTDVNSAAYARLFGGDDVDVKKGGKLTPAKEILRRIRWDGTLNSRDFSVLHYDRVDEKIVETAFDTANNSVQGREEMFVFAIPEHRVMAVKFLERTVWDKEQRLDCVFGSMNGNDETIDSVIATYNKWKQEKEEIEELNRKRQVEVSEKTKSVLGDELFVMLKNLSSDLQHPSGSLVPTDVQVELYVKSSLNLFHLARGKAMNTPRNDVESLDLLSELVAFLPHNKLRERILAMIEDTIYRLEGLQQKSRKRDAVTQLPELNEDDLSEQFVRGSGAGGQKVNKTSNRVVLVHNPTQVRVECQDTRSLSQNRKIARKRLRLKLDEYLNGDSSRTGIKATQIAKKKVKSKARNKSRQRKKKQAAEEKESQTPRVKTTEATAF